MANWHANNLMLPVDSSAFRKHSVCGPGVPNFRVMLPKHYADFLRLVFILLLAVARAGQSPASNISFTLKATAMQCIHVEVTCSVYVVNTTQIFFSGTGGPIDTIFFPKPALGHKDSEKYRLCGLALAIFCENRSTAPTFSATYFYIIIDR